MSTREQRCHLSHEHLLGVPTPDDDEIPYSLCKILIQLQYEESQNDTNKIYKLVMMMTMTSRTIFGIGSIYCNKVNFVFVLRFDRSHTRGHCFAAFTPISIEVNHSRFPVTDSNLLKSSQILEKPSQRKRIKL